MKSQNKLEVKYGLPSEVLFCKICNITNQRPNSTNEFQHNPESQKSTINFNKNGGKRRYSISKSFSDSE